MKTKVISILGFLFLIIGCSILETKNNDLKDMKLNGKVKSITESNYEAIEKFGEIIKGERSGTNEFSFDRKLLFNEKGNLIEEKKYKLDGNLDSKSFCNFDENQNKIERIFYDSSVKPILRWTYKYDGKGNLIEENKIQILSRLDSLMANYNGKNTNSNYSTKTLYKYDDSGNLFEKSIYKSDGSLVSKNIYKYDLKGKLVEDDTYNSNGSLHCTNTFKYDDNGNKSEDKSVGKFFFQKHTIKYDQYGNQIEINSGYQEVGIDATSAYKYEFDNHNNWIKKIEFYNNTTKHIIEREIEYY
jgi:hypothetical protein